jgi:hypothetical protein
MKSAAIRLERTAAQEGLRSPTVGTIGVGRVGISSQSVITIWVFAFP